MVRCRPRLLRMKHWLSQRQLDQFLRPLRLVQLIQPLEVRRYDSLIVGRELAVPALTSYILPLGDGRELSHALPRKRGVLECLDLLDKIPHGRTHLAELELQTVGQAKQLDDG